MYQLLSSSFLLFLLLAGSTSFITLTSAGPIEDKRFKTNPMLRGGYFQGDMVLNAQQRNGVTNRNEIWPNNIVYYKFANHFDAKQVEQIYEGMRTIEDISCIRFMEAPADIKTYVRLTSKPDGCYADVGRQAGESIYNLAYDCFDLGTILHEFLHTLGFNHMHTHPLRDRYININYENIEEGKEEWFEKDRNVNDFGTGYDYYSIMHYSTGAFAKHRGLLTIVPKDPNVDLTSEPQKMSEKDIYKLNMMYKCPLGL